MVRMKILHFVVLIALFAICHAEVANVPLTLNSISPVAVQLSSAAILDSAQANEFNEWAEYKVKSS